MTKTQTQTNIRYMRRSDLSRILEIERECFSDPWSEQDFIDFAHERNTIGLAVEINKWDQSYSVTKTVGYVMYSLHRCHLYIANMSVDPWYQRCGIGRSIMDCLKYKVAMCHRRGLACRVRETNLDAQLFLKAMGWRATDVVRDAYDNSDEDAYEMHWAANEPIHTAR